MRKYLFLISIILFSLNTKAVNVRNVYIAGDAMACGWTIVHPETMEMFDAQEGVFVWSGTVKAGDFKFLLESGKWTNCLNASTDNEAIIAGGEHKLVHVPNYTRTGNDYHFRFTEGGMYTIILYTKDMKMVVKKKENSPLPVSLWIVGSAIPGKVAKLAEDATQTAGYFRYHGKLQVGEFRIINTPTVVADTKFYVPFEENANAAGVYSMQITDNVKAAGWNVSVPDDSYKIKINTAANTLSSRIFVAREDLFIVGGATGLGWNAGRAIRLKKDISNPNVFTFSGTLKESISGNDRNMVKLLGQTDWGPISFHPKAEREALLESQYIFENLPGDHKWTLDLTKQGNYTIKVDLLQETIAATYNQTPLEENNKTSNDKYTVVVKKGQISVSSIDNRGFDYASLMDSSAKTIANTKNLKSKFSIGKNLKEGTYLLELSRGGEIEINKVIIK